MCCLIHTNECVRCLSCEVQTIIRTPASSVLIQEASHHLSWGGHLCTSPPVLPPPSVMAVLKFVFIFLLLFRCVWFDHLPSCFSTRSHLAWLIWTFIKSMWCALSVLALLSSAQNTVWAVRGYIRRLHFPASPHVTVPLFACVFVCVWSPGAWVVPSVCWSPTAAMITLVRGFQCTSTTVPPCCSLKGTTPAPSLFSVTGQ